MHDQQIEVCNVPFDIRFLAHWYENLNSNILSWLIIHIYSFWLLFIKFACYPITNQPLTLLQLPIRPVKRRSTQHLIVCTIQSSRDICSLTPSALPWKENICTHKYIINLNRSVFTCNWQHKYAIQNYLIPRNRKIKTSPLILVHSCILRTCWSPAFHTTNVLMRLGLHNHFMLQQHNVIYALPRTTEKISHSFFQ